MNLRTAAARAAIVLIPTYSMAFLTEKMVYVIPMLAATSFFAAATDLSSSKPLRRLDQEEAIDQEGAVDVDTTDADGYTDNS